MKQSKDIRKVADPIFKPSLTPVMISTTSYDYTTPSPELSPKSCKEKDQQKELSHSDTKEVVNIDSDSDWYSCDGSDSCTTSGSDNSTDGEISEDDDDPTPEPATDKISRSDSPPDGE